MPSPGPGFEEVTIGSARLIRGDCREVLPTLPIDAILTDPPFFTPAAHYQSRVDHQRSWGDLSILAHWWDDIAGRLVQLSANGHCLVFCGADAFAAFYPAMFGRWAKTTCLVWDKGHVGLGRIWRHQHELIIAARGKGAFEPRDGILRSDILKFAATPPKQRAHPVEKPAAMLAALVQAIAPEKGLVADPFMGSGTVGVACSQLGRSFIGIEIEPRYFDIACERIAAAARKAEAA